MLDEYFNKFQKSCFPDRFLFAFVLLIHGKGRREFSLAMETEVAGLFALAMV
jgi:hypothetical protein